MKYTLIEAIKYINQHLPNEVVMSIGYEDGTGYKFYYTTTKNQKSQFLHIPVNYSIKLTENKHDIL